MCTRNKYGCSNRATNSFAHTTAVAGTNCSSYTAANFNANSRTNGATNSFAYTTAVSETNNGATNSFAYTTAVSETNNFPSYTTSIDKTNSFAYITAIAETYFSSFTTSNSNTNSRTYSSMQRIWWFLLWIQSHVLLGCMWRRRDL